MSSALPEGVAVLERGWLSSNNVVIRGSTSAAMVDTGYATHAPQTLALARAALGSLPLTKIVNTHLHSDHCGGNALLQTAYPDAETSIPPGLAAAVRSWDTEALTYAPTGQTCPRFSFDGVMQPGEVLLLGDLRWEVHSAPGHDPHSVILFEARSRCLISADALWENGFGIVFPELEGASAFDDVRRTLDVIERLAPQIVIPGHGGVFTNITGALSRARSRLEAYVASPARHAAHASKVLLKFKILELQQIRVERFVEWAEATRHFSMVHERWFAETPKGAWIRQLIEQLVRNGAMRLDEGLISNS
jgi:glyoxylase-like metal-dependent hydrolase (beta-lactamase superfamily II)